MKLVSNSLLGGLKVDFVEIIDLRHDLSPTLNHIRTLKFTGTGEGLFSLVRE
jgi:hypothetical protein